MKRTLFIAGVVAFTALGCFYYLNLQKGTFILVATGVLALVATFLYILGRASKLWVAVTVPLFLFSALYFYCLHSLVLPVTALQGHEALVVGQVISAPEWDVNGFVCRLQTQSIALQGAPQNIKLLLRVFELEDVVVGDILQATVRFAEIDRDFYADGVYIAGQTPELEQLIPPQRPSVLVWIEGFRRQIRSILNRNLPGELAGYVQALLLGDKSRLSARIESAYRVCGLSHLLAVSGLHLSLICAALQRALTACRSRKRLSAVLMMLLVTAVMAVTGFSPSVVRAGCMYLLMLAGRLVSRKGEPLNFLGAAVLIMLLVHPFAAGSLSLLLSAGSVAGILLLGPYLQAALYRLIKWYGRVGKALRGIAQLLAVTLSATMVSLPAQILVFGEVSLLSVLANLLVSGISGLLLIASVVGLLLAALLPVKTILIPLFWCITQLADYCTALPLWLSRAPFTDIYLQSGHVALCVGFGILIAATGLLTRPAGVRGLFCGAMCLIMLCCSCFTYMARNRDTTHIAVFPGERGSSVVLTHNRFAVVIGLPADTCGAVYAHLRSRGIQKAGAVLLPQEDPVQARQAQRLGEWMPVCTLQQKQLLRVQQLRLWAGANIEFYHHSYGTACCIRFGQRVCFVTAAGVDFSADALQIGAVDLLVCDAAVPTGLITKPGTVCLLASNQSSAYLAAGELSARGIQCYISPQGAKTVAKFQKNGYSYYSYER